MLWNYKKKWNLIQYSQAEKKGVWPQECCCEKRCEIISNGQEITAMIG